MSPGITDAQHVQGTHTPPGLQGGGDRGQRLGGTGRARPNVPALWPTVSVSINNLYPGCENVSVRSRSMMFEPGLTKGVLEVFGAPSHHPHCATDDQSTKAIDIQNAYLNGRLTLPKRKEFPAGNLSRRASATAALRVEKGPAWE